MSVLLLVASMAMAVESPAVTLQRAERQLQQADFPGALLLLDSLDRRIATAHELARGELLKAEALFAIGRIDEARASLSEALRYEPSATLDPKVSGERLADLLEELRRSLLGVVTFEADSRATAAVDGADPAVLPLTLHLKPGRHQVAVTAQGRTERRELTVKPGTSVTERFVFAEGPRPPAASFLAVELGVSGAAGPLGVWAVAPDLRLAATLGTSRLELVVRGSYALHTDVARPHPIDSAVTVVGRLNEWSVAALFRYAQPLVKRAALVFAAGAGVRQVYERVQFAGAAPQLTGVEQNTAPRPVVVLTAGARIAAGPGALVIEVLGTGGPLSGVFSGSLLGIGLEVGYRVSLL